MKKPSLSLLSQNPARAMTADAFPIGLRAESTVQALPLTYWPGAELRISRRRNKRRASVMPFIWHLLTEARPTA